MKWTALTYDFDKSKQIYKVRFNTSGTALPSSTNQVCFFAETPNINCDGLTRQTVTGATYGYASENRFGIRDNIFCSRYYNFTDEYWTAHTHTTAISATVSEFECPVALYYAGATAYNDVDVQTVLAEKVSVFVESTFELDKESISFNYNSGLTTVELSSENPWTASTNDSWVTLSQYTGLTDATITVSVPNNYNNPQRTGTVTFTDGEDTLTLTITQKADTRLLLKNIFFEDKKAKMIIRNGNVIYRMLVKSVFSVDTNSIEFESTGGTDTFNITANDSWSMTIPNFITVSSLTGYGNATITVSTTGETSDTELTGNIVITCGSKTHTIAVKQKSANPDYSKEPLTFEILSAGTISWYCSATDETKRKTISYSTDNGNTWTDISATTSTTINVNNGDIIKFKGDNQTYYQSFYNNFENSTAIFDVYGNIMSLIDSTGFTNLTTLTSANYNAFYSLFRSTKVRNAENLILPATTLATQCYTYMFYNCTGLTSAPELPATTLASQCYNNMFYNCSSLVTAPELPATTLASYCYQNMFYGCSSLVNAPELPATTLVMYCYSGMFYGCKSLTSAPELPATTLTNACYGNMFRECTSLNYIKCLATDISATNCTNSWVYRVQTNSGTFVKAAGVTWPSGGSGIPNNWTVQEE